MNQKIEWYKEVLALEPSSKVFFPLARLQVENGMPDEALTTLRHGISRNPEHIEARLLLIDILFGSGQLDALWPELDQIALMLGGYPGFWSAWNARLARNPSSKDASLALNFFSAALRGEAVSWSDVIEQGLRGLLFSTDAAPVKIPPKVAPAELNELKSFLKDSSTAAAGKPAPAVVRTAVNEAQAKAPGQTGTAGGRPASGQTPDFSELRAPAARIEDDGSATFDNNDENEPEDEVFSLKTRSMAEVLAEQGDYAGALDIYEELARSCTSVEEKKALEEAIAGIKSKAGVAGQVPASAKDYGDDEDREPAIQGKNRLLSVLDALASRLEARS
jgi:tetratricopeptide (TPR) repeat protein